jgi:RNA polymerase-binding transcription factor DksA
MEVTTMTRSKTEAYRRRLFTLAERYSTGVSDLRGESQHGLWGESGGGFSDVPTHPADLGNTNCEEDLNLALLGNQEQLLGECNAALARIDAGTYGLCEECRRPIRHGRLQASPYARHCIACARKREVQPARY